MLVAGVATVIYWLCARQFDAGRGDFFYLAEAFLDGRTWLDFRPGPYDVIVDGTRYFVPFAPFPAVVLMPLVALVGAVQADLIEPAVNALLAGATVGSCWWLLGRLDVDRIRDRLWLTVLFGFSSQILWVTTRGGVWHTGQLIAILLTTWCLIEMEGRRRAWLIGLLAGAAFLTRAPLAFAIPFYALLLTEPDWRPPWRPAWRSWFGLAAGALPALVAFFWYNAARFGSPLESGYALAVLPDFLERQREIGLFSLAHLPMNLDYFLVHLPRPITEAPFFMPDGLGMSVLLTSPAFLLAFRADPWAHRTWLLGGAALAVLAVSLLYYGGGWLQYGYRYFLDSLPFVIALCAIGAVRDGGVGLVWRALIVFGVVVMTIGVYWAYNL